MPLLTGEHQAVASAKTALEFTASRAAIDAARVERIAAASQQCDEVTGLSYDLVFSHWTERAARDTGRTHALMLKQTNMWSEQASALEARKLASTGIAIEERRAEYIAAKARAALHLPPNPAPAAAPYCAPAFSDEAFNAYYLHPEFVDPPGNFPDLPDDVSRKLLGNFSYQRLSIPFVPYFLF
jgi:hypothetical protein